MPRRITGAAFVSIDGVIQAGGGPHEDPTRGFPHGGWMGPFAGDQMVEETLARLFHPSYALLLGRRTYDIFAGYWPHVTGEEARFGEALTAAEKHVLTHSDAPLEWANSHALSGIAAIEALVQTDGPDLLIQGSSTLYPPLLAAGLIDRLVLMTFPVVLGEGKRLFDDPRAACTLRLIRHEISKAGVIAAHYEPAGPIQTGSVGPEQEPNATERARRDAIREGRW